MDFRRLVESGKYSVNDLDDEQKEFLKGLDFAISEIETAAANLFNDVKDETLSVIEKMIAEIQEDAAEQIKQWLYVCKCEFIVCLSDENACKKEMEGDD